MKFVISLFFTLTATASPIHLFHEGEKEDAVIYRDILMKNYLIPEELILIKKIKICEVLKTQGKLDLCLKNNGDLYMVSVDREFINESLKVFQAP
jgi:hypothetical protein